VAAIAYVGAGRPAPRCGRHRSAAHPRGPHALLLTTGIVEATVMPHVVYLHSAMTSRRTPTIDDHEKRHVLHHQRWDIGLAMGLAGLVNVAMLVVAAALFHGCCVAGRPRPRSTAGCEWARRAAASSDWGCAPSPVRGWETDRSSSQPDDQGLGRDSLHACIEPGELS